MGRVRGHGLGTRLALPPQPHSPGSLPIDSRQLAAAAAHLSDEKKGTEIKVLYVADHLKIADYFVLISAGSRPHVRAIYNELHVRLKTAGQSHARAEGVELGWWVLIDYGDVVVHILQPEAREYYELDALYGECPVVDWRDVELPELPDTARI